MRVSHKFPATVSAIGFIKNIEHHGQSRGSGVKVRCTLFNPSVERPLWDLYVPVIAMGRAAQEVLKFAADPDAPRLVHVFGRMAMVNAQDSTEGPRLEVIAEIILPLDEE